MCVHDTQNTVIVSSGGIRSDGPEAATKVRNVRAAKRRDLRAEGVSAVPCRRQ